MFTSCHPLPKVFIFSVALEVSHCLALVFPQACGSRVKTGVFCPQPRQFRLPMPHIHRRYIELVGVEVQVGLALRVLHHEGTGISNGGTSRFWWL
ncbi:hypothetical protein DFH09DRAFT_1143237 [Mycena vulgaris]|nr:hypothetical protein DFH09DRAFT_1143237 [Mycena vulgaris]